MGNRGTLTQEVVRSLEAAYDMGDWQGWDRTPKGHANISYFVTTSSGKYVVRCSSRRKDIASLRFELQLVDYLQRKGYPAPEFVPARGGEKYHMQDGAFYVASRFIQGSHFDWNNPKHLQEAGRGLGLYHRYVQSYPGDGYQTSLPTAATLWTNGFARRSEMERMADESLPGEERRNLAESLSCLEGQFDRVQRRIAEVSVGLKKLITQGSYGASALIFNGDSLAGVVDYDRASFDFRGVDLAYTAKSFCRVYDEESTEHKVGFDINRYRELMAAYQKVEPLSRSEIEAFPVLSMAQRLVKVMKKWNSLLRKMTLSPPQPKKLEKLADVLQMESSRVTWLERHGKELIAAC
jgi:Ser/Thr protein kinase RdoA (MazF antagonist)